MNDQSMKELQSEMEATMRSVIEKVEELREASEAGPGDRLDTAIGAIRGRALEVSVRSDWYSPGEGRRGAAPAEYRVLLVWGGPSVQVVGDLDQYGQPQTAKLQGQGWFMPWTDFDHGLIKDYPRRELEGILLEYAQNFYFGD